MIVACERSRCRIACRKVGRVRKEPVPDRVPYDPSHGDGRRVPYRPSPDRVPYGPSPDHESSYLYSFPRPRCPCRVHGRASRTSVIGHAPAQQRLEPTPPSEVYEHLFFCAAVAFHHGPFGGAAKANRWAALLSATTNARLLVLTKP